MKAFKALILQLRLYAMAAWVYELYRLLAKPQTHGALVAVWHQQRLLLVEVSYRQGLSLPGGGIHRGETPRQAAVRELAEELGLRVNPEALVDPWSCTRTYAGGSNTVTIFSLQLRDEPVVQVDGLELVGIRWLTMPEALTHPPATAPKGLSVAQGVRP